MSLRDELLARFPRLAELPRDCYVVGGAIRDLLLGIDPVDVDVSCDDPPAAARQLGVKVIRLGTEEHLSAWRVVDQGHVYDVAALLEGEIDADLARRDFTVNAMAVALDDGAFLDPHGGRDDIDRRLVRMIDASNFDDDPLRCLKAVRMAVRFEFDVDEATVEAIRSRADAITSVAPERVTYELSIIFSANRFRRAVDLLRRTRLDVALFGRELTEEYRADEVSLAGAMALLVENPRDYARAWRWSSDLLRQTSALQRLIGVDGDRRVALFDAGEEVSLQLPGVLRALGRDDRLEFPDFSTRAMLTGEEIAELAGIAAGPDVGRVKRALLEAQIRGEVKTRGEAVTFVRSVTAN